MILVVIPFRNYSRGVLHLLDWWQENSDIRHELMVINDHSSDYHRALVAERTAIVDVPGDGQLRWAYKHAADTALMCDYTFVLTCESDAEPRRGALEMQLVAADAFPDASAITCVYRDDEGTIIYPTLTHRRDQWETHLILGRYRWQQQISMTVTLWRPAALAEIDDTMATLFVDADLRNKLWKAGHRFIELGDVSHGHGGMQTRRRTNQSGMITQIYDEQR